MKRLAIIPARGGSKRILRKNIKPFLGTPIISYSIEAALQSNLFETVMVSTDDEEIAAIAKQYGAEVPFKRSAENSDDYATTVDVLVEVMEAYKQLEETFDYGCCIYPTAPFVNTSSLQLGYDTLTTNHFDTVFPVIPFSFPIQRAVKVNRAGKMDLFQPEYLLTRSQDLEPAFHDAGQFYWFKIDSLIKSRKLWTENTGVIKITEMEAQDIDSLVDWKLAEMKYKILKNNQ